MAAESNAQMPQGSAQMYGQVVGINKNLADLITVMRSRFALAAFTGSFTMAAAATKTVTDANCVAGCAIQLQATNAAAGTLEGSAKHLYVTPANGAFTVGTASAGSAAGTETYNYTILKIA